MPVHESDESLEGTARFPACFVHGHERAVAGLEGEGLQIEAALKAAKEGWSVRQIESFTSIKAKKKPAKKKAKERKDADTLALEERLSEDLGTRVTVEGSSKKGKIIVEYFSSDELDRLIEQMSTK